MINAIQLLRTTADKCESKAKETKDRAVSAELSNMTVEWHWLAKKAAELFERAKELETA